MNKDIGLYLLNFLWALSMLWCMIMMNKPYYPVASIICGCIHMNLWVQLTRRALTHAYFIDIEMLKL